MEKGFHGRPQGLTADNWDRGPFNRWAFQHVRELVPTVNVARGLGHASALPARHETLATVAFSLDGEEDTVGNWLETSHTDGFLVIEGGAVTAEIYDNHMSPRTPQLVQSVSKSVTSAVAGCLVAEGVLDPEDALTRHLPELASTAYAGATIRHVLDMTSGVVFEEDYTAPQSHCARLDAAAGWKPRRHPEWPGTVFDLVLSLGETECAHGSSFRYRSIETDVLAFAMERASGLPLAELVSRHVWAPMGAESDASFTVDPSGYALADGGFNATLRDLGRFGLMVARRGRAGDRQVVPAAWIEDCLRGDPALFNAESRVVLPQGAYRNQFWVEEAGRQVLLCRGVFGQLIYIDLEADFVAVKLSSWPDFVNPAATRRALAAIRAIRDRAR
ncbi:serine hydrolase domain-containing protein [Gellertiella hungarica]|uniref:CubicO group peptidase (Beta-lactamase class C family) n=1 Tax=Gellertiella hungarica TaxID=1572859 RepID=A0A7W6J9Z4_9HYPH|nr:CubicO group peptidase (beta-lactamase class C family) [Gellertiella hungarica]